MNNIVQERDTPCFSLQGRTVIVTGAGDGIGKALAIAFSTSGAEVIIVGRRRDKLEAVKDIIQESGGKAEIVCADLADCGEIDSLARNIEGIISGSKSKLVLVNNAGFAFTKPALDITEVEWNEVFNLHAKGTFFCCKAISPLMIQRGYGKIINLSSTWSKSTAEGKSIYGAAKAAVSYMTAALSTEWAEAGVRVNAIAPTATLSDNTRRAMEGNPERAELMLKRIKLGRFAEPGDITGAAIFLASSASDFITGQTIFVDGGWNAAS